MNIPGEMLLKHFMKEFQAPVLWRHSYSKAKSQEQSFSFHHIIQNLMPLQKIINSNATKT